MEILLIYWYLGYSIFALIWNCLQRVLGKFVLLLFSWDLKLEVKEISQIPVGTTDGGSGRLLMASQKAFVSHKFFKSDRNLAKWILFLPQPVAIGSAALQLRRVIEAEQLSVSWEVPMEKEGDHTQVGPLKVCVLPSWAWIVINFGCMLLFLTPFFSLCFNLRGLRYKGLQDQYRIMWNFFYSLGFWRNILKLLHVWECCQ